MRCRVSNRIELPFYTTFGVSERDSQMREEFVAGDGFGAEGQHVGGGLLAIHDSKSPRLELTD